ncbi:MAG: response regulator [Hyphomicrobiaceae bacterium]
MSTVLVIDDHPIVLQGCKRILEDAGIDTVLESSSLATGIRLYRAHNPEMIIIDLSLKSGVLDGLTFIRRLRLNDRKVPILVFSMHNDPIVVNHALEAGANGYVLKDTWSDEFLTAFNKVREGGAYISHELASEVVFSKSRGSTNPLATMTLRELQILSLVAEGKSYGAIAEEIGVSYKTIANSTSQIKNKIGVHSLPELMRVALQYLPSVRHKR